MQEEPLRSQGQAVTHLDAAASFGHAATLPGAPAASALLTTTTPRWIAVLARRIVRARRRLQLSAAVS